MSIESLSADVSRLSTQLEHQLQKWKITSPTSDESGRSPFSNKPPAVRATRNALVDAAVQLARLAQGPEDHVLGLAMGATTDAAVLGTIIRFGLPSLIPLGGSETSGNLAQQTSLSEPILARILRYAVGLGIFQELTPGSFSHSAASARLAGDEHLQNIVLLTTHNLARIMVRLPDALHDKAPTAFNLAFPEHSNVFEYFAKDTQASARYHHYLLGRVNTSRWAIRHLQTAWRWADVGSGTIVDVGGSSGHTCIALAEVCPQARFIIQDIDREALAHARTAVAAASTETAARTSFEEYDFFTPQKTTADIYIFRHILHDWSDADTVRILRNLVPALQPGARVLISEGLLPAPPARQTNVLDDKMIRIEDMFMLAVHDAPERSRADFERLFTEASPSFRLVGTTGGENGAFQSLLEFEYVG
ncbi:hypothetical protein N0V95_002033 [Ascochyta clinopodiicola]|nr:hypothetical protein N0V95_002033 [Ascochyta clinopodiicola]